MSGLLTIVFWLIGIGLFGAQILAVVDGVGHLTGLSTWWSILISSIVAMVPGVNALAAIYGAISVWHWPWYVAVPIMAPSTLIFFWAMVGSALGKVTDSLNLARSPWVRWPLMVVGTFLGSWLVSLAPVITATLIKGDLLDWYDGTWAEVYVVTTASALFGGFIYGHLACRLSPAHKLLSGAIMSTAFGTLLLAAAGVSWALDDGHATRASLMAISWIIGSICALIRFRAAELNPVPLLGPRNASAGR